MPDPRPSVPSKSSHAPIPALFALMISAFTAAPSLAQHFTSPIGDPLGCDLCAAGKIARLGDSLPHPLATTEGAADPGADTDALHNDLSITIDTANETLTGSNTITLRSLADNLTTFRVRIRDQFSLPSVLVDGAPAAWTRLNITTIEITLPTPKNTGDTFTVTVAYSGVAVSRGFGSIEFGTHAGTPIVATLSEPWFAYTWWPHKDDGQNNNRDKATADIRVTTPDWMSVASNGVLQSETLLPGGLKTTHWATSQPMTTYLLSIAATNYVRFTDTYVHDNGVMPLVYMLYPETNTANTLSQLAVIKPMLDVFGEIFGPYPYLSEKYGVYQFNFGGGMEHQTMSGQGSFGESLTAHELAHQWWGDDVTTADWNNIWLNEGFATYSEALWFERKPGGSAAALQSAMAARRPVVFDDSTYIPEPTSPSRIFSLNFTYRKGAWILHMLRGVIGDNAFFDSLARFRDDHAEGAATTDDFRLAVEAATGEPFDWYFDQWVFGIGAPNYQHAFTTHTINGARFAEVLVRQNNPVAYPTFTMPIPLRLTTTSSTTEELVWNTADEQHFLIPIDGPLTSFEFDPQTWILAQTVNSAAFSAGPPKIVAANPAPIGPASLGVLGPTDAIQITFHEPVAITSADAELLGPTGPAAVSVTYDPATLTATITPSAPLETGAWTLTLRDTITSIGAGLALDGETGLARPAGPLGGDGTPGGDAVFSFTVASPADLNADGVVNGVDLLILLSAWGDAPLGVAPSPDINSDGAVDGIDLLILLSAWG